MANIIDEFVMTVALDATNFAKGQKELEEGTKRLKEHTETFGKSLGEVGRVGAEAFQKVREEALGFLSAFIGIGGVVEILKDFTSTYTELGRASGAMRGTMHDLQVYEALIRRVGGTVDGAQKTFQKLSDNITEVGRGRGSRAFLEAAQVVFGNLNLSTATPMEMFKRATDFLDRQKTTDQKLLAQKWLADVGFGPADISAMQLGPAGVRTRITDIEKRGVGDEESVKNAQRLTESFAKLREGVDVIEDALVNEFGDALIDAINGLQTFIDWFGDFAKKHPILAAVGVGAGAVGVGGLALRMTTGAIRSVLGGIFGANAGAKGAAVAVEAVAATSMGAEATEIGIATRIAMRWGPRLARIFGPEGLLIGAILSVVLDDMLGLSGTDYNGPINKYFKEHPELEPGYGPPTTSQPINPLAPGYLSIPQRVERDLAMRPDANMSFNSQRGDSPVPASFGNLEQKYRLPSGVLATLWQLESSGGKNLSTSSAGAVGPFQFMPETGAQYGLMTLSDLMDPEKSAAAAAHFFSDLLTYYGGDVDKALAGYNAGMGRVNQAMAQAQRQGGDWRSYMKPETQDYLIKAHRRQPGGAGPRANPLGPPRPVERPAKPLTPPPAGPRLVPPPPTSVPMSGAYGGGSISSASITGPITIHTAATDAAGIARDLVAELERQMGSLANTGLA